MHNGSVIIITRIAIRTRVTLHNNHASVRQTVSVKIFSLLQRLYSVNLATLLWCQNVAVCKGHPIHTSCVRDKILILVPSKELDSSSGKYYRTFDTIMCTCMILGIEKFHSHSNYYEEAQIGRKWVEVG